VLTILRYLEKYDLVTATAVCRFIWTDDSGRRKGVALRRGNGQRGDNIGRRFRDQT
jgi:hypothetical protein